MNRAVTFVENGEFHDDLTVFVVRLAQNSKSARGSQQDDNKEAPEGASPASG